MNTDDTAPPKEEPTPTDLAIREAISKYLTRIGFLDLNRKKIDRIGKQPTGYGQDIDFDYLPHAKVIEVMKEFPGTWKKEYNTSSITYTLLTPDGWRIRCYAGEPPPNCQIVEEEVEVAAVPAHTELKRKIVCK